MKRSQYICLLVILLCYSISAAQVTVSGSVTDAETREALPGANVYLSNTTLGDDTDSNGNYRFNVNRPGIYELVFSFTGYKRITQKIDLNSSDKKVDVLLYPQNSQLDEIKVSASRDRKWEKYTNRFKTEFIGARNQTGEVTIQNPEVLRYDSDNGNQQLYASTTEPLIIINKALGYRLYIELESFEWLNHKKEVRYEIYSRFESLEPDFEGEAIRWKKNRIRTYIGSFPHFLKTLYNEELESSNFVVKRSRNLAPINQSKLRYSLYMQGFDLNNLDRFKGYRINKKIDIEYENEISLKIGEVLISIPIRKKSSVQPANRNKTFLVRPDGMLLNPYSLTLLGDWSKDRIGETLPANYNPPLD